MRGPNDLLVPATRAVTATGLLRPARKLVIPTEAAHGTIVSGAVEGLSHFAFLRRAAIFVAIASANLHAQQGTQPPPFTAPAIPTPAATDSPGQQPAPAQQTPQVAPNAPLPQPDQTTVDLRNLKPLAAQPATPTSQPTPDTKARPEAESNSRIATRLFTLAPYRAARVPALPLGSSARVDSLVRDGKLYLSLHDAISLAIENNLDVEVSRYNLLLADTDLTRAQGGGTLRGLDYTIAETPAGVGSLTSPLLVTATTGNATSTNANVTDLSQIMQSGSGTQQTLSENNTSTFSAGPAIPVFDPVLSAQAGYLRRSDQTSLISTTDTTSTGSSSGTSTVTPPLDYISTGIDYQQGFRTGAQIDAFVNNAAQVLYAGNSQYDPFKAPSTSFTITQPLLRGRGSNVNTRFIRIARLDKKVSQLVFEQQLLETIYGVSRLYYDLVSLGENIGVQEESLASAERLYQDDKDQVDEGTLAPIELTRAQALRSSSRLSLIQAQGEYRQQESILREQLLRKLGGPASSFVSIIPTDKIAVPDNPPALDVPALTTDALANRPDLAQAGLQVKADEVLASAAGNSASAPLFNVYANVQTRGSSLVFPLHDHRLTRHRRRRRPTCADPGRPPPRNHLPGRRAAQPAPAQPHRPGRLRPRHHPGPPGRRAQPQARERHPPADRKRLHRARERPPGLRRRRRKPRLPAAIAPGREGQILRRREHQLPHHPGPGLPRPGPRHRGRRPLRLDEGPDVARPRPRKPARKEWHRPRRCHSRSIEVGSAQNRVLFAYFVRGDVK